MFRSLSIFKAKFTKNSYNLNLNKVTDRLAFHHGVNQQKSVPDHILAPN